jgi:hypothetical protein
VCSFVMRGDAHQSRWGLQTVHLAQPSAAVVAATPPVPASLWREHVITAGTSYLEFVQSMHLPTQLAEVSGYQSGYQGGIDSTHQGH